MWQVLKYACPVWHPGLTAAHSDLLESVQKRTIRIFYPDANYQYQTSLIVIGIDTLHADDEILQETRSRQQLSTDRRDNDTISSLRNAKPFHTFRAH